MRRAVALRRRAARALRAGAASWCAAAAAGCTRYEVAPPGAPAAAPPAGARVRVTLTEAGRAAIARTAAGAGVVAVEGEVAPDPPGAAPGGDSLRLRPERLLTAAGVPVTWGGGEVAVARADVQRVERRVGDRTRTAWLVAGAAAAGAAFLVAVRRAGGGARGGGGGDGPPTF